ncbi:MAG TPA: tRNA (adenosine(37)-N6)-threonylcarbamoyltransferase complex transferase subunit TsaD [Tepidisphaeraceae bacterium]|jgi:N6-L-threonylcarbamoyladenine synthase|nr:tRNA (adenosine(37)-N6)-threonylcarbamoyltransferase complex transferase subunit TsaD [Tepidisphaeraceae bacterium]
MTVLGIESTCDETAAAVVADGVRVRSSVVASQVELHARYRGVVPEIASRAHIENILPVVIEALDSAGVKLADVEAVGVAHRPGLIGSLLIGVTAAKTLAWALGKPLIGVDHVHAHLYSVRLETGVQIPMPAVGLVCSGGHTALYRIGGFLDVELIGSTLDDAVGEAYDKVAAILALGYPGGPVIDQLARQGNPSAIRFPRSRLNRQSLDFSFSGLKTSVLYHVRGYKGREREAASLTPGEIRDVAASFQAACVDVLVEKVRRAARRCSARSVIIGGGVSANSGLRMAMSKFPLPVFFPPLQYCTDNAAMIAALADVLLSAGGISQLDLDAIPHSQFSHA